MRPTVLGVHNRHRLIGGAERYYLELGRLLAARGHRVVHLSTAHPENEPAPGPALFLPPNDLVRPGPADLVRFHYSRRAARAVRSLLSAERIDLAHLHIYHGQLTAAILAPLRRAGVPLVQTLHEYKLLCPVHTFLSRGVLCEACGGRHFHRALPRRCNRGSLARTLVSVSESYLSRWLGAATQIDHFVAVSEFVRGKMIAHGFSPERITTIPHFVDAERTTSGSGPGEHFLYAGRLEGYKGIFTLLEAAAEVRELPLLFAGEGNDRAQLEREIEARKLSHVRCLGFRRGEELAALLRASRCAIVPSQSYETFGLAALEAFACARPVVASAIGALPELVTHGEDGLLFPAGDAGALAQHLRWLATHPAQAAALGARGRQKALERYSPQAHHDRLLEVYRRLT